MLKGCLDRANCIGNVCGLKFEAGRTAFVIKMLLVAANLGMSGRFVMLACKQACSLADNACEAGTPLTASDRSIEDAAYVRSTDGL